MPRALKPIFDGSCTRQVPDKTSLYLDADGLSRSGVQRLWHEGRDHREIVVVRSLKSLKCLLMLKFPDYIQIPIAPWS